MKTKTKKKNLGRVYFELDYVVDLDNPHMVEHAKQCIYEDVMTAYKYDEVQNYISVKEDKKAKAKDIPEFLLDDGDYMD